MKTCLSSIDLHYMVKELEVIIDGKIGQIYAPSKKQLMLQFHIPNKGKQQLRIDEKSIYLTEHKFPADKPSEFCMYLRKKLNNARLRKIKQLGFERILEFEFENKEGKISLIFELFSRGNIILVKDDQILTAAERQNWAAREIAPKKEYIYPKREYDIFALKEKELKELLETTNKESIVKSLAIDLGLGGIYAEEVCLLAGADKNQKPSESDAKNIFNALDSIKNKRLDPHIIYEKDEVKDITPFQLKTYKEFKQEKAETFSKALDSYFSKNILSKENSKHLKKIQELQTIIEDQKSHIKKLEKIEIENKEKAELLYKNYQLIDNLLKELKEISKTHPWKEIKEKLKGHKLIKEVDPKDKSIIIEL